MSEQEWEDKLAEVQKHSEHWYNKYKELENKIADIKANCDYVLEGKEIEYREERNKLCADFENMKATLESKIAELEQQIEKMKCCQNCKFKDCDKSNSYQTCWYCKNKNKWQLRR